MKANRRLALATATSVAVMGAVTSANAAETQIILASVGSSVSISAAPTASVDLGALPATAASLGSITVASNTVYLLTAQAAKPTMTAWNATTETYTDTVKLATQTLLTSTASSGLGVGVPATVVTDQAALVIGTGATGLLVATTDVYALAATQLTAATDVAGTYRNVITYTASAVV